MNGAPRMRAFCSSRRAFTLVELLIVIIIIGILAGAMLLVRQSGQDKADATVIIEDLRTMKAAALMYDADNPKRDLVSLIGTNIVKEIEKFLDRPVDDDRDHLYIYPDMSSGSTFPEFRWYVFRKLFTTHGGIPQAATEGCRKRLADMAKETGLIGLMGSGSGGLGTEEPYKADDYLVGMRVK